MVEINTALPSRTIARCRTRSCRQVVVGPAHGLEVPPGPAASHRAMSRRLDVLQFRRRRDLGPPDGRDDVAVDPSLRKNSSSRPSHDGLDAMRSEANRMLESVLDLGRGGHLPVEDRARHRRAHQPGQAETSSTLVTRRSASGASTASRGRGAWEAFHIGRVAVSARHEPLVVDWRAPVAEPSTGHRPSTPGPRPAPPPCVRGRKVTGLEDEYFAVPDAERYPQRGRRGRGTTPDRLIRRRHGARGPGALLAALGQARTGRMGDIVATIQREQTRYPLTLPGVLLVQGAPGRARRPSPSTVPLSALHAPFPARAPRCAGRRPTRSSCRYIEQVLPSLGETGVTLSTVSASSGGQAAVATTTDRGAPEGRRTDASGPRPGGATRQRPLREDVAIPFGQGPAPARREHRAIVERAAVGPAPTTPAVRFVDSSRPGARTQYERIQRARPSRRARPPSCSADSTRGHTRRRPRRRRAMSSTWRSSGARSAVRPSSQPRWSACGAVIARPMSCSTTCSGTGL